ncbi:MAG TPA: hypothetical protein VFV32_09270 [Acidimicrobiales bacterium]|nr:hypothetical protein [Acidimicrobiales bacterium]
MRLRWALRAVMALLPHPGLWRTGLQQALRLAPPGWWRRFPFLPLPAPAYLRFRMETAYGGAGDQLPVPGDLVTYLHWCQRFGR